MKGHTGSTQYLALADCTLCGSFWALCILPQAVFLRKVGPMGQYFTVTGRNPQRGSNNLPTNCVSGDWRGLAGVSDTWGRALPFALLASCFITPGTRRPKLLRQVLNQACLFSSTLGWIQTGFRLVFVEDHAVHLLGSAGNAVSGDTWALLLNAALPWDSVNEQA